MSVTTTRCFDDAGSGCLATTGALIVCRGAGGAGGADGSRPRPATIGTGLTYPQLGHCGKKSESDFPHPWQGLIFSMSLRYKTLKTALQAWHGGALFSP